ncbi:hypothetical protein CDL12_19643 [Handroanthus impetiginosus]|uniref:Uncharacterized protein n=1 Tax=Handroanthus impetiginosus TaxID=429701 RepID=A0A2G9GR72_9LAMI|nr:hypothetical protein CDL12_19643 [Handroanthus impetiginosus]
MHTVLCLCIRLRQKELCRRVESLLLSFEPAFWCLHIVAQDQFTADWSSSYYNTDSGKKLQKFSMNAPLHTNCL